MTKMVAAINALTRSRAHALTRSRVIEVSLRMEEELDVKLNCKLQSIEGTSKGLLADKYPSKEYESFKVVARAWPLA